MKIIVFDTETTGFINKKEIDNLDAQPYLVQFAGIYGEVINWEFKEIERINELVKPIIPIPYDSSLVHHIYDVDVQETPWVEAKIDQFLKVLNAADVVVGHNIEYDDFVINTELKRLNRFGEYNPKKTFCTMKETVDFVAVKGNGERFKYPKLGELHKKLFWEYFIGAHDAMVDVEATLRCFVELYNKEIIKIEEENQVMSLF